MPTIPTDPLDDMPVLEPPRDVSDELTDAHEDGIDEDVSTSQFINANPPNLKAKTPSVADSDVSSVDLADAGEGWTEVDTDEVPAVGSRKEELGWETVALASAVAECDLAGEDEYSIETFRSSKKKEELSE